MTINPVGKPYKPSISCSPVFKGVILNGMEEVIGPGGLNEFLNRSDMAFLKEACQTKDECTRISYHDLSMAQLNLEELYGQPGGRGLALIAGRNYFTYGMRQYGKTLGLHDLTFKLLPLKTKLNVGLTRIARLITESSDSTIHVEESPSQFHWSVERCPLCWKRHSDVPICHMQVGMLQEFTYWVSGGKIFSIVETECSAAGAETCVFTINKVALE
jgi:predicted hydrocarbon binding protein